MKRLLLAGAAIVLGTSLQQMAFASPMSTAAGLRLFGLTLIAVTIGREHTLATSVAVVGSFVSPQHSRYSVTRRTNRGGTGR